MPIMIDVVRKLSGLSSMGLFLRNTEYKAQLNPAEMVHMSPLPNRTEMSADRFP